MSIRGKKLEEKGEGRGRRKIKESERENRK
jgi:hypothetical protein